MNCNIESKETQMDEAATFIEAFRNASIEDQLITYGVLLGRQSAQATNQNTAAQ